MSEWIKCSEKLPPIIYLPLSSGYCDGRIEPNVFIIYLDKVVKAALWGWKGSSPRWYIPSFYGNKNIPIIDYWMPIPNLPEKIKYD